MEPERLFVLLNDSEESRKVEQYVRENLSAYCPITYYPAADDSIVPAVYLENSERLIWGEKLWQFLEILKTKFDKEKGIPTIRINAVQ